MTKPVKTPNVRLQMHELACGKIQVFSKIIDSVEHKIVLELIHGVYHMTLTNREVRGEVVGDLLCPSQLLFSESTSEISLVNVQRIFSAEKQKLPK